MQQQGPPDKPAAPSAPPPPYEQPAVPVALALPVVSPQVVYVQVPASPNGAQAGAPAPPRQHLTWKTGVCGCGDNCCNLWMGLCCTCVTYGQISERVGHNGCCECGCCGSALLWIAATSVGCNWLITCLLRQKVAEATGVDHDCCGDCLTSCCCGPCVTCQMATHLDIQKDGCSFAAPPRLESMQR